MFCQNRREQGAAAAAYVNNPPEATKVIGLNDGPIHASRQVSHCPIEDHALLRVLRTVFPGGTAVHVPKRVFARADCIQEAAPGPPLLVAPDIGCPAANRLGGVSSQTLADRS